MALITQTPQKFCGGDGDPHPVNTPMLGFGGTKIPIRPGAHSS
jgi:hypothetical protein